MSSDPLNLIDRLLRAVPGARTERMTLRELIEREAESLMAAHRAGRPEWAYLIRGDRYRPGKSPATDAELRAAPLTRGQARGSIVRFHWFEDEAAMLAHADEVVDPALDGGSRATHDRRPRTRATSVVGSVRSFGARKAAYPRQAGDVAHCTVRTCVASARR